MAFNLERFIKGKRFSQEFNFDDTVNQVIPKVGAGSVIYNAIVGLINSTITPSFPVGSVYINALTTANPASILGFGTWVQFGQGRVLIGIDFSDPLFNSMGNVGGSKDSVVVSHSHSINDPGHIHSINTKAGVGQGAAGPNYIQQNFGSMNTNAALTNISVNATGSSGTNANLQPYVTVAMWVRTA